MKKLMILCLVLTVCLSGCVVTNFNWFNNVVAPQGDLESYEYTVGEFNKINVSIPCEIRYYASASDTVKLDIQSNLEQYVSVEVRNGELLINSSKSISLSANKTPVLTVRAAELTALRIAGACSFESYDKITGGSFNLDIAGAAEGSVEMEVDTLRVSIAGAGRFILSGSADAAELSLSGAGFLDALSLQTRDAKVTMAGAGSVRVNCSETLEIDAGGMGTVEYKGSPRLDLSKGGLVNVKKAD